MKYRQNKYGNAVQISSESDGWVTFCNLGRGFQQVMSTERFYAHYDREWEAKWELVNIGADWMEVTLKAWSNGKSWKGWAMPFFELDQALEAMKSVPGLMWYPERDCFEHKDEHKEAELVTYPGTTIEVDGRPVKVYWIGVGWYWECWGIEGEQE